MKLYDAQNFKAPIAYEERIVVFFDVLGWKGLISDAGDDPAKIGNIALIPRILSSFPALQVAEGGGVNSSKITSFSDCCVVSIPFVEDHLPNFIYGLSNIFIGCAIEGFLLRAGLTIGKIYHDEKIVFGPAMNCAYKLESEGVYPRIVIDSDMSKFISAKVPKGMISKDEKGSFINPYDWSFINSAHCLNPFLAECFAGVEIDPAKILFAMLEGALHRILSKATKDEHRKRAGWPYSMVSEQYKKL